MASICVDSDFFSVDGTGNLTFVRGSVGLKSMSVFSTPGTSTFTKASFPGLQRVHVRVVGGGGGASGAQADPGQASASPGGNGGWYAESVLDASALPASLTITVGAGGGGGATQGDPGLAGQASSFGSLVIAPGGNPSTSSMPPGTVPDTLPSPAIGAGTITGQIRVIGGVGDGSLRLDGTNAISGRGGTSGGGMGSGGGARTTDSAGASGSNFGGGGSGACSLGGTRAGGSGAGGIVIVELHF